jgi:hypothetical protein
VIVTLHHLPGRSKLNLNLKKNLIFKTENVMECKTTPLNFERPGNVSFEGSSPLISVVAFRVYLKYFVIFTFSRSKFSERSCPDVIVHGQPVRAQRVLSSRRRQRRAFKDLHPPY